MASQSLKDQIVEQEQEVADTRTVYFAKRELWVTQLESMYCGRLSGNPAKSLVIAEGKDIIDQSNDLSRLAQEADHAFLDYQMAERVCKMLHELAGREGAI